MLQNGKMEKWKSIRVPESLWHIIRMESARKGIKIYQELKKKYE